MQLGDLPVQLLSRHTHEGGIAGIHLPCTLRPCISAGLILKRKFPFGCYEDSSPLSPGENANTISLHEDAGPPMALVADLDSQQCEWLYYLLTVPVKQTSYRSLLSVLNRFAKLARGSVLYLGRTCIGSIISIPAWLRSISTSILRTSPGTRVPQFLVAVCIVCLKNSIVTPARTVQTSSSCTCLEPKLPLKRSIDAVCYIATQ